MLREAHHRAIAWLIAAVVCAEVAALLITRGQEHPSAVLWAGLATQGLWIGLALGIASLGGIEGRSERLGLGRGRLRASTLVLLVVGLLALSDALNALLIWVDMRDTGALAEIDTQVARTQGPSFLLALLAVAIAPGIGEELLFRGLLQRALTARIGAFGGVCGSAALFAVAHFDLAQSSSAFLLGLYLGAVAHLAGSVRAAMLCHVVNNTLALITPRLGLSDAQAHPALVVGVLMLLAAGILGFARWREGSPRGGDSGPDGLQL